MRPAPFLSLVAVSLALLSGAEPAPSPYAVHEKRAYLPPGWSRTKRHNPTSAIPLRFALKQNNIQDIGKYLYDVSHPKSSSYGKHWSSEDIADTFSPSDETVDTVRSWLVASGIGEERISLGRSKGWIHVDATVEEAERLIQTEYNVYKHTSGKDHVACEIYHLPEHVQPHVDFIIPTVHFDARLHRRSDEKSTLMARHVKPQSSVSPGVSGNLSKVIGELEECDRATTPVCLRTLYDFFYEPVATDKNSFGVTEYTPEAFLQNDLQMFARNYSTDLIGKEPLLVSIDGGYLQTVNQSLDINAEANLDVQYAMSMATGKQVLTVYQAGDLAQSASYNNFLDAIDGSYCTAEGGEDPNVDGVYPDPAPGGYAGRDCGTVEPTYVISTSYSYTEADLTTSYAERQCIEYAKLGLMGITFVFSSGDYGVAGSGDGCLNPDGTQSANGTIFNPKFPGTCPYITSIGSTMIKPNGTVSDPEVACMGRTYSGGGFSNYFAMPDYQEDAVNYYLTNYYPDYPSTIWNSTGMSRGYPDISLNGANYIVAVNGRFRNIWGTSCATPVVGAMFTMINDARLALGKGTIGFVNPALYSPEFACAFNDITEGSNPGCGTAGYNATEGWDPVTGLGTPKFSTLLELWSNLP